MPLDLPEHDHCRYCGDAIPFEQAYCSEECYYADQRRIGREKRRDNAVFTVATAGTATLLLIGYFL